MTEWTTGIGADRRWPPPRRPTRASSRSRRVACRPRLVEHHELERTVAGALALGAPRHAGRRAVLAAANHDAVGAEAFDDAVRGEFADRFRSATAVTGDAGVEAGAVPLHRRGAGAVAPALELGKAIADVAPGSAHSSEFTTDAGLAVGGADLATGTFRTAVAIGPAQRPGLTNLTPVVDAAPAPGADADILLARLIGATVGRGAAVPVLARAVAADPVVAALPMARARGAARPHARPSVVSRHEQRGPVKSAQTEPGPVTAVQSSSAAQLLQRVPMPQKVAELVVPWQRQRG